MIALRALLWVLAAWWAVACVRAVFNLRLPRLQEADGGEPPSLTVLIPARDEADGVEAAVLSHCTQDYPGLQVVVVDDRSTDATPAILRKLQDAFPNLEIVRGEEPPEGWVGKQHALALGLVRATGRYVLIADADVRYAPGTHARAVREMVRDGLDGLALMSRLEGRGLEPLVLSMFPALALYAWPTLKANAPGFRYLAIVAPSGLLVQREAFEAAGGVAAVRSEVLDDLAIANMMKTYRDRYRLATAFDSVRHRMYRGLAACVEGFSKNYLHFFKFGKPRPFLAFFVQGSYLAFETLPVLALGLGLCVPEAGRLLVPAAIAVSLGILLNAAAALWSRQPLWIALAFPLRPVVWSWILLKSTWRYYRRGVVWRGRTYTRPR